MFVIEYFQDGKMHTVVTSDSRVANAMESFLVCLATVTLIIVWEVQ